MSKKKRKKQNKAKQPQVAAQKKQLMQLEDEAASSAADAAEAAASTAASASAVSAEAASTAAGASAEAAVAADEVAAIEAALDAAVAAVIIEEAAESAGQEAASTAAGASAEAAASTAAGASAEAAVAADEVAAIEAALDAAVAAVITEEAAESAGQEAALHHSETPSAAEIAEIEAAINAMVESFVDADEPHEQQQSSSARAQEQKQEQEQFIAAVESEQPLAKKRRRLRPAAVLICLAALAALLFAGSSLFGWFAPAQVNPNDPATTVSSKLGEPTKRVLTAAELRDQAQQQGKETYYVNGIAYDTASGDRRPLLVLTFDDGPSADATPRLVQGLNERGVKATFFVLGVRAQTYPEVCKEAAESGHLICSHGWDHKKSLINRSKESLDEELNRAAEAIYQAVGYYPPYVRPAYGEINSATAARIDVPLMMWTIDPRDWQLRDAAKLRQTIMNTVFDGGILLCHDIYETTVDAVLAVVDELLAEGWQFVTLDVYYQLMGIELEPGLVYRGPGLANIK